MSVEMASLSFTLGGILDMDCGYSVLISSEVPIPTTLSPYSNDGNTAGRKSRRNRDLRRYQNTVSTIHIQNSSQRK